MKNQGHQASQIRWGIELETRIPTTAGVNVGGYHHGLPVHTGIHAATTLPVDALSFQGTHRWIAERDASIRSDSGQMACEFVRPILHGEEGIDCLLRFVEWARAIGATVNDSCGCHTREGRKRDKTKKDFFKAEQEALESKQAGLFDDLA